MIAASVVGGPGQPKGGVSSFFRSFTGMLQSQLFGGSFESLGEDWYFGQDTERPGSPTADGHPSGYM
jgi:hypothetical protein